MTKSLKFCTLTGNRGRRIERRCINLHGKFINKRFCACAVQMLLKMVVNETIRSTFEVQYCKSTSTRTSAIRHLGHLKQITWFRACAETHTFFNKGPWIIFADNFNFFIVLYRHRSCIVNRQIGVGDSKYVIVLTPYSRVTWFGACAVAAYAFSMVINGKRYNS